MDKTSQSRIISVLAALMLFFTYIACGFAICAGLPMTTEKLSLMTSDFESSPYNHDDLVALAQQTRDFTIDDYGRHEQGSSGAEIELATFILERARSSADPTSPTHDRWSEEAISIIYGNDPSPDVTMTKLYEAGAQYSLDDEAISHLNDVNDLVSRLFMPLLGIAILAAFCLMAGVRHYGYICAARSLLYAGCATFAFLLMLVIWALISFDSLFSFMHSLFFVEGTWTFPTKSLLIEMYPIGFWVGMGTVWLISSGCVALLSVTFGALIKRSYNRKAPQSLSANSAEEAKPNNC